MRAHPNIVLLLVVTLAVGLLAQEVNVPPKHASVAQTIGERDKEKEGRVAKLFETIRADAKIPHLKRIEHRDSLEQTVCTIALTGQLPKRPSGNTFLFFRTANPEFPTPELIKVASFNRLHPKNNPSYARYSVAVWRVKAPETGELSYWVGVQLYWSAGMEFFDYHFTDDIYYHNDWKKSVAPPCRGK